MAEACPQAQRPSHLVRRAGPHGRSEMLVAPVWPSPFTSQPYADAWVSDEGDGVLTLYVGDRCLAVIRGLALDQRQLNHVLDRFRHCPPRPRRRGHLRLAA